LKQSQNLKKKVLQDQKLRFAGLQNVTKSKYLCKHYAVLSFPSSEVQHSLLRCCAIIFFSEFLGLPVYSLFYRLEIL